MMKQLMIKPAIYKYEKAGDFAEEFALGKGDLVITNEYIYEPYFGGLNLGCDVLFQEKYGAGEPSDDMAEAMYRDMKGSHRRIIAIGGGTGTEDSASPTTTPDMVRSGRVLRTLYIQQKRIPRAGFSFADKLYFSHREFKCKTMNFTDRRLCRRSVLQFSLLFSFLIFITENKYNPDMANAIIEAGALCAFEISVLITPVASSAIMRIPKTNAAFVPAPGLQNLSPTKAAMPRKTDSAIATAASAIVAPIIDSYSVPFRELLPAARMTPDIIVSTACARITIDENFNIVRLFNSFCPPLSVI